MTGRCANFGSNDRPPPKRPTSFSNIYLQPPSSSSPSTTLILRVLSERHKPTGAQLSHINYVLAFVCQPSSQRLHHTTLLHHHAQTLHSTLCVQRAHSTKCVPPDTHIRPSCRPLPAIRACVWYSVQYIVSTGAHTHTPARARVRTRAYELCTHGQQCTFHCAATVVVVVVIIVRTHGVE